MPTYQVCKARKAQGTTRPKGAGYCNGLRGDGTASRKAQTLAKHDFRCVTFKQVPSDAWGKSTLVKVGPRNATVMADKLSALANKFNN